MFSDFFIFCLFGVILSVLGPYRAILGMGLGPRSVFWGLLIKTDNFYFVRYFVFDFFIFCLFGVILNLLGPYRAIFGVGMGSENFFGLYVYRLTIFVF